MPVRTARIASDRSGNCGAVERANRSLNSTELRITHALCAEEGENESVPDQATFRPWLLLQMQTGYEANDDRVHLAYTLGFHHCFLRPLRFVVVHNGPFSKSPLRQYMHTMQHV